MATEHVIGEGAAAEGRTQADIAAELARMDELEAELASEGDDIHPDLPRAAAPTPAGGEAEREASKKGWVPKAKWVASGKPADQWVDAGTFNRRGEAFVKNLQSELTAVKAELESFKGTAAAFRDFQKKLVAEKDAELQVALRQLRLQHKEAIRDGNDDEALELEDRIDQMKANNKEVVAEVKAPVADPNAPVENPVLAEWIEDGNSWFKSDDKLRKYAVSLGEQMIAAGETLRGRKFLDKVAATMREEFPRSFRETGTGAHVNDKVSGSSGSRGSGETGTSVGGRTARDLPAADRQLMRQFIAEGMYTEEEFLKSYFARN